MIFSQMFLHCIWAVYDACRKGALSLCERDSKKYAFAMQLTDYQAFTPPPPLLVIHSGTKPIPATPPRRKRQLKIKSCQLKNINRLIHDFNKIFLFD
jgi:hypothetical protein